MDELVERIQAAIVSLEQAAQRMQEREVALFAEADERVERIVATVESQRETELAERLSAAESKLHEAEARIAELSAAAAASTASASGRKTAAVGMVATLAKQGISAGALQTGRMEAGALDAALTSLSIEQRFAVKAEMLRAGLLG